MIRALFAFCLAGVIAAACATGSRASPAQPRTVLEVDNRARFDMTIYVLPQNGPRHRLGTATAHMRAWFTIPARFIFGLTPLRFQADPIGSNVAPVTERITVEPGDTVVLTIPPRSGPGP